ncbi:hypothetical protein [Streptomyces sp. NPDC001500]
MSAHPPLALAAATVVAFVLLLRWGATPRPRPGRHRDGFGEPRGPLGPSAGAGGSGPGPALVRSGTGPVALESVPSTSSRASASASRPAPAAPEPVAAGAEPVRAGKGRPVAPEAGGRGALGDAERHLSAHWERLRPLYPHVHDTAAPRRDDR